MTRNNDDGKGDLALVYIEGRDQRGMGLDFVSLTDILRQMGGIDAIGLDGGRSSALTWRTSYNPNYIYTANKAQRETYAVGNIFGIIKNQNPSL